jgi:hypothetical protein
LVAQPKQIETFAAQGYEHSTARGQIQTGPVSHKMPINGGLMEADLRRSPALLPKLRLHALGFPGRFRVRQILWHL